MIKKVNKIFHNKNNRLNFFLNQYQFSFNTQQTVTYPYVFGGLKNIDFVSNKNEQMLLKQIHDENVLEGFKQAYRFIIHSLALKDKKSLQNICEPTLLKNLTFKNVELVNPDAEIQVICKNSFKIIGATSIREPNTELKILRDDQYATVYVNTGFAQKSFLQLSNCMFRSGFPTLTGCEVFFRSAMKLEPQGGKKNQSETQIHSIQFQMEGRTNYIEHIKTLMLSKSGIKKLDPNDIRNVFKSEFNDQSQWKVGDIDLVLKGNLNIID